MLNTAISLVTAATVMLSSLGLSGAAQDSGPSDSSVINCVNSAVECPVLTYHNFTQPGDGVKNGPWSCSINKFESDIRTLISSGYSFVSTYELYLALNGRGTLPEKPVLIEFDDGYLTNYTLAFPILKRYNAKADIYVVTDRIDGDHSGLPAFDWDQAREMEQSGLVSIYLHGGSHDDATSFTPEQFRADHLYGWQRIEDELGKRPFRPYVYPGGEYDLSTLAVADACGDDMQFIWAWGWKTGAMDYPVYLRMNVSDTTDPVGQISAYFTFLERVRKKELGKQLP